MGSIISAIVSALSSLVTIVKTFFDRDKGRKQEYYKIVLKPFIVASKINPDIDAISFVKSVFPKDKDDYIPKYIYFIADVLKDQGEDGKSDQMARNITAEYQVNNERLKKVLLFDYSTLYANERNRTGRWLDIVIRMANAFIFVIAIALIGLGLFMTVISLLWFLEGVFSMELAIEQLKYMVIGIVIVLIASVAVLLSDSGSQDMYTLKKRKIEIIISKKVSAYDKRKDKYVL